MANNTFGKNFCITTFGESHGEALGVVIDGCPSGVKFDLELLNFELQRRRPGQSKSVSQRQEQDEPHILSGIFDGKTLGTPIAIIFKNTDQKSQDYEKIKNEPRTGHADDVWKTKFGHVDYRGGGRSSGRETVARVAGGAVAQMFLKTKVPNLKIESRIVQIGTQKDVTQFEQMLIEARDRGDSYGGVAEFKIKNLPAGVGEPVFRKLKSQIAQAIMTIGATNGITFGDGDITQNGVEFHNGQKNTQYGGIRGGISTGEDVIFYVHFKPTSSILDVAKKGRHDPCIIPRAIPVVENMVFLVLADLVS